VNAKTFWLLAGIAELIACPHVVQAQSWTFDEAPTGRMAAGFTAEVGIWVVVKSDSGHALAQQSANDKTTFNIALATKTSAKDLILSVRMKAVAGKIDQGGGLVWRAKDARNYYLARYNPLEDNYRVYKVVDGKRTQLASADIPHAAGWHTLLVVTTGDHILCSYDGNAYLDVRDAAFADAGRIGLWSKADAQSEFDDLSLTSP
jgi:hypothetical protein